MILAVIELDENMLILMCSLEVIMIPHHVKHVFVKSSHLLHCE